MGDCVISTPSRLTHDISLEEFEDEDLSEITDECGISLHCKESLATRVSTMGMGTVLLGPSAPMQDHQVSRPEVLPQSAKTLLFRDEPKGLGVTRGISSTEAG